jgi:8-oxo-dGTP pyrophosphatase MutT (NUDIX family)
MTTSADGSENPWTTRSTRWIYENPWIKLREDQVTQPDGRPGIYGVVEFRNRAVGVLAIDAADRVWLVGQYRYPLGQYSWEIPEGGCPSHESLEGCARRELREETGLICERLEPMVTSHLSNSVSNEWGIVYRAVGLTEGPSEPEGTERLEVRQVPFVEALAMLGRGEITDSLSVMALLHEAARRGFAGQARRLFLLEPRMALVRLGPDEEVPAWAMGSEFLSVTRTADELSVVVCEDVVPSEVVAARGYRALRLEGPIPLDEAGVLAGVVVPLARAGVAVFVISTVDTDYLLVREEDVTRGVECLRERGNAVVT